MVTLAEYQFNKLTIVSNKKILLFNKKENKYEFILKNFDTFIHEAIHHFSFFSFPFCALNIFINYNKYVSYANYFNKNKVKKLPIQKIKIPDEINSLIGEYYSLMGDNDVENIDENSSIVEVKNKDGLLKITFSNLLTPVSIGAIAILEYISYKLEISIREMLIKHVEEEIRFSLFRKIKKQYLEINNIFKVRNTPYYPYKILDSLFEYNFQSNNLWVNLILCVFSLNTSRPGASLYELIQYVKENNIYNDIDTIKKIWILPSFKSKYQQLKNKILNDFNNIINEQREPDYEDYYTLIKGLIEDNLKFQDKNSGIPSFVFLIQNELFLKNNYNNILCYLTPIILFDKKASNDYYFVICNDRYDKELIKKTFFLFSGLETLINNIIIEDIRECPYINVCNIKGRKINECINNPLYYAKNNLGCILEKAIHTLGMV